MCKYRLPGLMKSLSHALLEFFSLQRPDRRCAAPLDTHTSTMPDWPSTPIRRTHCRKSPRVYRSPSKTKKSHIKHKQIDGRTLHTQDGAQKESSAGAAKNSDYDLFDLTAHVHRVLLECSFGEKEVAARLMETLMEEASLAATVKDIADGDLYSPLIEDLENLVNDSDADNEPRNPDGLPKLRKFLDFAGHAAVDEHNTIVKMFHGMLFPG